MQHSITVSVKDDDKKKAVVKAKELTVREKVLSALFGKKAKVLVITPYDTVSQINIAEKGVKNNAAKRSLQFDCN
ncbi:MAG: hypothetical protein Q4C99_00060 [Clostridia bacterium]|nr:hypothetical protein [Clostridia bacterium]